MYGDVTIRLAGNELRLFDQIKTVSDGQRRIVVWVNNGVGEQAVRVNNLSKWFIVRWFQIKYYRFKNKKSGL